MKQEDEASRPPKRPRTESESMVASWTHHPDLYISDGSLVLLAEDTVFRVYGSLLSKQSEVFKGMPSLSAPQPSDAETYDECPLVRLTDTAEDLAVFLNALIDFSFFPSNKPVSFRVVSSILRLSTKYKVHALRQRVLDRLAPAFPTNFDSYEDLQVRAGPECGIHELFDGRPPNLCAVVNLFRRCQVDALLPYALYLVARRGPGFIFEATAKTRNPLSPQDKSAAILAHGIMQARELQTSYHIFEFVASGCIGRRRCSGNIRLEFLEYLANRADFSLADPLYPVHAELGGEVCTKCQAYWGREDDERRRAIWNDLPGYFGLPSWDSLMGN